MNCFLNLKLANTFAELVVVVVTIIFFIDFVFSSFFITGIILINSPTLAAINQIVFKELLLYKQNFSLNLFVSSLPFNILKNKIIGDNKNIKFVKRL